MVSKGDWRLLKAPVLMSLSAAWRRYCGVLVWSSEVFGTLQFAKTLLESNHSDTVQNTGCAVVPPETLPDMFVCECQRTRGLSGALLILVRCVLEFPQIGHGVGLRLRVMGLFLV